MFELALICFLIAVLLCIVGAALIRIVDSERPRHQQRDWVAERHRKISRNGFKSRMGVN